MSYLNVPDSAQSSYISLLDAEDECAVMERRGMAWCYDCNRYMSSTREVRVPGGMQPLCRECRPFDRPCEYCGRAEREPGFDGCLTCEVANDLAEIAREA